MALRSSSSRTAVAIAGITCSLLTVGACASTTTSGDAPDVPATPAAPSTTTTTTALPAIAVSPSTTSATSTTTSTTAPPSTTGAAVVPATTSPPTTAPGPTTSDPDATPSDQLDSGAVAPPVTSPLALSATNAAFDRLAAGNPAMSMTVIRDGVPLLNRATGTTIGGMPATSDSPMVVASVSKLMTAIAVARSDQTGLIDIDTPIPWTLLGLAPHPGWNGVTARELLRHAAGMPVVRTSWFTGEGDCRSYLPTLMANPPGGHRGVWTYSNGNFCALGILIETVTGLPLDEALDALVFTPAGVSGAHLTTDGQRPDDIAYRRGVARLSRLGGAGGLLVSTDSIAGALAALGPADYETLGLPSGFVDQYGFGYTGTVGGAVACAWVLEGGRTVVAATVSGERPSTGGAVCDLVEPALAADLGFWAGTPRRSSI